MPNRRIGDGPRISRAPAYDPNDECDTVQSSGTRRASARGASSSAAKLQSARPGPRRRRRRVNPLRRAVLAAALIALAAIGAYAGYVYKSSEAVRRYAPLLQGATIASCFPGVAATNLMIVGRDYDYNDQDQVIRSNARSDMLMVAHIDFVHRTATLLSIPRDTAADIPGHGVAKINAAHAFGGPPLAEETIYRNFGIPVDHYVALDFDGFQKAIDLLGGVDCTVDKKMDYDDNWGHLHIHLLPGYQHLDGEQAMDFVRFRHSDSDLIRIRRQQDLLAALKLKLVQPQTLAVLPALLDTIDTHIASDLTDRQKVALAVFLHSLPESSVSMTTLPSTEGGEFVHTDFAAAEPMVKQIFGVEMPGRYAAVDGERYRRTRYRRRRISDESAGRETLS